MLQDARDAAYPIIKTLTSLRWRIDEAMGIYEAIDIDTESEFEDEFEHFFEGYVLDNLGWKAEHQKRVDDIHDILLGGDYLSKCQAVSKLMLIENLHQLNLL